MIRLDNLTKVFDTPKGAVTAADHISMEVPSGEICILLGPSGCGKTTTLKMINRIIRPTSGKVFINGEDTTSLDTQDLRRNIGYVIQQIGLFPNMTIEENITVVPKLLGWDKAKYRERAREMMHMIALEPDAFLKRYPSELSGGQQQRIGVARALAADPPVMLMDEPFGAIDPINRAVIQDEFLKMQQELKKTIMFVSHDIDEAIKMGDRIAIFRAGKLVQYSEPDELLAAPKNDFVESFLGEDRALKRLNLVKVRDLASEEIGLVRPDDTLATALQRIESYGYQNSIVMVNHKRQPVGIITAPVARTTQGHCRDHYQSVPVVVSLDDDLRKVASLMFAHDMTWVPCVDDDGRIVGQITQRAITHHLGSRYRAHSKGDDGVALDEASPSSAPKE
ncbi:MULTISPECIES: ABC transporter ATP-binding protein [Chromohalobacter]|uniref:Quaternary amine transport ATP-binding protein n=1 Tax=Chromohalobacter israelensis (strain ATCC BAA-138 / DSM 3043 / CIP 106854 / NCIMB 13768 / 1H11) TaxID=290398 RepID=Q1QV05_CHRI1|nr:MULTISPECIES: ABC transporter ATP-binding protein [Chromohalobacter]ABE59703.1 glycine betaine/L-proline transport ATP binding subunit [Chromohalobacter salexigens DSM 3043]NQY47035.1 ABC transporter ATP-binding protein [Chromohalobacter sp.]NWO57063.1 CBS domain-containing protein [Chromohalobacter salexigens]PWW33911.1 osmoprotectant transport system ATP-binding protein [Chromohalobacter salexigens]